jgi:hypothetical protein
VFASNAALAVISPMPSRVVTGDDRHGRWYGVDERKTYTKAYGEGRLFTTTDSYIVSLVYPSLALPWYRGQSISFSVE